MTPTLSSANTTLVTGSISGTDGDVFRIQYFKSSSNVTSSSRFAQGEELIAWQDVTIVGGTAAIDEDINAAGVIVTDWITATATLLDGGLPAETSQFSFGIWVTAERPARCFDHDTGITAFPKAQVVPSNRSPSESAPQPTSVRSAHVRALSRD